MTPVPETITFPSLVPSARSYVEGQHPINKAQTMAGISVRRLLSAQATEPELRLKFQNIPDASAEDILSTYDKAYGTRKQITLPSALTAGLSTNLATLIRNESGQLRWYFMGRPSLESTVPGRSTVSVALRARLVPAFTPPEIGSTTITPPSGPNVVNGYACLLNPNALGARWKVKASFAGGAVTAGSSTQLTYDQWQKNGIYGYLTTNSSGELVEAQLLQASGNLTESIVTNVSTPSSLYDGLTIAFTLNLPYSDVIGGAVGFGILDYSATDSSYIGSGIGFASVGIYNSSSSPHFISFNAYGAGAYQTATQGIYVKKAGEIITTWSGGTNFVNEPVYGTNDWRIVYAGTDRTNMTVKVYKNTSLKITVTGVTLPATGRFVFGGGTDGTYGAGATIMSAVSFTR
jgi:hypothetical protein